MSFNKRADKNLPNGISYRDVKPILILFKSCKEGPSYNDKRETRNMKHCIMIIMINHNHNNNHNEDSKGLYSYSGDKS